MFKNVMNMAFHCFRLNRRNPTKASATKLRKPPTLSKGTSRNGETRTEFATWGTSSSSSSLALGRRRAMVAHGASKHPLALTAHPLGASRVSFFNPYPRLSSTQLKTLPVPKMSLSLVQGYESPEEEPQDYFSDSDEEYAGDRFKEKAAPVVKPNKLQQVKPPPRTSDLPTAFEMFTEVTGPPDFLKHSITARVNGDLTSMTPTDFSRSYVAPKEPKPRHTPTAVAVVQAKPQVSNVEQETANAAIAAKKRAPGAGLPPAEDAANLLRMCANCGVPKTYSGAKEGMVCPLCGDRPVVAGAEEKNKRGNKVKDKEHSKRMKGQSAHSTWKSETEMHLRQQFD